MTEVRPAGALDWAAAEAVAAAHREQRLPPALRARRADRVLLPVAVVLWVAAVVLAMLGSVLSLIPSFVVAVPGYGAMFAYLVIALIWGVRTGRWMVRGSAGSIRAALPAAARDSVRRQLALREPVDAEHRGVIVELAHQNLGLLGGQVAFLAFYVPLFLNLFHTYADLPRRDGAWFAIAILPVAGAALLVAAVFGGVAQRRFTRLIRAADDA